MNIDNFQYENMKNGRVTLASAGFRGQLGAVAPPSPSLNRSGAPILENERHFEELAFGISVEEMTPQLLTAPPLDLLWIRP